MDQYLAHHGILGQKWGVRRFQNPDGSYTKEGIERYGKKNFKKGNIDRYQVIPKGTKFYRITTNDNETGSSSTYMSTNKKDAAFYTAYISGNNPGKNSYKVTYKNNMDLKIPSQKVLKETEEKLLKNKKYRKEVDDGLREFIFQGGSGGRKISEVKSDFSKLSKIINKKEKDIIDKGLTDDEFDKVRSAINSGKITNEQYNNAFYYFKGQNRIIGFMNGPLSKATDFDKASLSLVKAPEFRRAIQKDLEKQGYNAMMDEAGLGRLPKYNERLQSYQTGVYTREGFNTMIVFNPDTTFSRVKTQKITYSDEVKADQYYNQRRSDYSKERTAAHSEIKEAIMLKITTTNGDTLIHGDQQPDAITGTSYDGSQYLVHAGAWGHHKYIRKEGNRYIYPEDLKKANDVQKHRAEVLADRRIAKKDRAHVKEDKEITKVMREELNKAGYNIDKAGSEQIRRAIKTDGQTQSAHQQSIYTIPGTYNQQRRATDPEAAKAQIAERRRRKEVENRPLRTADQQASAHQTSIKKTDNADGSKEMWRRVTDADTAKAQIKERREKKRKTVNQQLNSAHAGAKSYEDKFPDGGSTEELNRQKEKTKVRKTAKETMARTDTGIEAARKRKKKDSSGLKGHKKNVIHGNLTVSRGSKVKTNGPVGSR